MFTPQKKIFLAWSLRRESNSNSNAIVSGNGGIITGDDNDVEDLDAKLAKLENEDTDLLLTGGMEKVFRIYDLNRPDAPPREVDKSPGSVRTVAWLHSDQTILSSCTDIGGVRMSNVLVISFTVCGYLIFSWKEFKVMGNGLC